jgi:hypothetical protein
MESKKFVLTHDPKTRWTVKTTKSILILDTKTKKRIGRESECKRLCKKKSKIKKVKKSGSKKSILTSEQKPKKKIGKKIIPNLDEVKIQYCNGCEVEHPITDFSIRCKATGVRHRQCRKHQKKVANKKKYTYPKERKCPGCKFILPIEKFRFRSKLTGRREYHCGKCTDERRDLELKREKMRNWSKSEKGQQYKKEYNEKYKPIRNAREKERCKEDPIYRLKKNVRCRVYDALKNQGQKSTRKIKYLGLSVPLYMKWLEYQFDENMNWDNYGKYWEIDHIKPLNSFNLENEDEIYEAFDWKNTGPLEASENSKKKDKVDMKLINEHREIVEGYFLHMKELDEKIDDNDRYSYYTTRLCGFND